MEREVAPLDESERREHNKRIEEFREARKSYWSRVRLWEEKAKKEKQRREFEANREGAVERIRREVKHAFDPERASGPKRMSILP